MDKIIVSLTLGQAQRLLSETYIALADAEADLEEGIHQEDYIVEDFIQVSNRVRDLRGVVEAFEEALASHSEVRV